MTAAAVQQAIKADADLALVGPHRDTDKAVAEYLRSGTAEEILKRVIGRARPWRQVLRQWSRGVGPGAVEGLLLDLESRGLTRAELGESLGGAFHAAADCESVARIVRVKSTHWYRVKEQGNRWYVERRNGGFVLLSDFIAGSVQHQRAARLRDGPLVLDGKRRRPFNPDKPR